ncbi:MAG TPA: hypothetical protein PKZ32_02865 [Candidatus Melainabacteria bacterium]|nr:hypothetical protein [Candidatus Melainabacteria bacterium]
MKPVKSWFELSALFGCFLLGTIMLVAGYKLDTWESAQIRLYNEGVSLYEQARRDETKIDAAILAFDQSLDEYAASENRGVIAKWIYPSPSHEVAALAYSKKAVLLLYKGKAEEAVRAFKLSISLNSGSVDPDLIALTMPVQDLSADVIARLAAQAHVAIHNLEMLYGKKPSLQEAQGQGEAKGKNQDPEQAPGSKPAPGAGKSGDPNAI